MADPVCPRCRSAMEEGFVLDHGHMDARKTTQWVEGEPVRSFWAGGIKVKGLRKLPISTWRCTRCGLLESYAAEA